MLKNEINATVVLELLSLEKKLAALKSNCLAKNSYIKRPLSRPKKLLCKKRLTYFFHLNTSLTRPRQHRNNRVFWHSYLMNTSTPNGNNSFLDEYFINTAPPTSKQWSRCASKSSFVRLLA